MPSIDLIIENATILTMDPEATVHETGHLCITGDAISHVGPGGVGAVEGAKRIDAEGQIVLPGLINGHTHAAMALFRGLADDLPLMEWLHAYIFPVESKMDSEFVHVGALLACAEMILSGVTTFCDMYLFEQEVARAASEAGMRALVGEVLYDFPSPNYGPPEKGLQYTESLIHTWRDDPLVSIAVEPHSLFTCSPNLLSGAGDLAAHYDVPLIIHVAETQHEVQEISRKYGKGPVDHLDSLGLLDQRLIADHCVHLADGDIQKMSRNGVRVVHNPESNMKLASGIAPVPQMLAHGLTVGLGTDGCASNNNLDMFTEMDMAAKLHKVNTMEPTAMDAFTVLRMATIQGAEALGMGGRTGSLEVGKQADVIVVDMRKPHLTPLYNPYSHLVYSARGNDVSHTIINGRLVMEDRKLMAMDLDQVIDRAREQAVRVKSWVSRA
jgi:5-methylthioadenosine/S-adenosylhomocysteine deaminase